MPAPEEISAQIAAQIATAILKTPKQPPQLDAALISSGLIDSFHLVDLALFVEDTFGVRLDDGELNAQQGFRYHGGFPAHGARRT